MTRGTFRTRDGCTLGYVDEGAGLPVLWQHGLGATQAQPAEVFPASSRLRRITLECRGHGDSELGAPEALSITRFTEDAAELLDHLHIGRAVVGGISLGAAIVRLSYCWRSRHVKPGWRDGSRCRHFTR